MEIFYVEEVIIASWVLALDFIDREFYHFEMTISDSEIQWLEFDLFQDFSKLQHASLLRHGGYSKGPYESLNLGLNSEDEYASQNLNRITETFSLSHLVWAEQCHSSDIQQVTQRNQEHSFVCDGLSTGAAGLTLMIRHADCQAAIFYDPIHHAVANVHSGWRGNVQNIYAKTIAHMGEQYGSKPEDLLVGISPSLGPESAEFILYKTELPESFWKFQKTENHFDFWEISRMQLEQCGVLSHHIEIAGICTYSNPEDYFSYRRDRITGRHGTIVTLL